MDPDLLVIFGTVFAIVIGSQLIALAKKWIERNNNSYDERDFDKLAKAFIQYKKESERRFQNLEAIIADDEPKSSTRQERSTNKNLKKEQLHNTIEIEDPEPEPEDRNKESGNSNLRNMLKE